jgi:hypothetical protein
LQAGDKRREIVRHGDEKDFWSRPESPGDEGRDGQQLDDQDRALRVTNYVETPEPAPKPEDTVVRVEYRGRARQAARLLELVRQPGADAKDKTEYLARSEHSRWYATVLRSSGEQIDQDLASVLAE